MTGFTPGSSHAMHIHQGSCTAQGAVLVAFPDVTADEHGVIDTTVTGLQPSPAGLAAGTLLNIHLAWGAALGDPDSLGYTPVSCVNIAPGASTAVTMAPPPQPAQHLQGSATLTYSPAKKTLSVTVNASGLLAGSVHAVDIHSGSCESQGPVKYPLSDLTASPTGAAAATTFIEDVDELPPAWGWYLDVHLGSDDQIEQNGQPALPFDPIMCGNIGK
jgi:Cu/Zn superoxide dismutase